MALNLKLSGGERERRRRRSSSSEAEREREREEGGAQVDDRASERIKHSFLCERELGRNTGRKDDEGTTERRERRSAKRRRRLLGISSFLRRRCCLFSKEFHRVALRKLQWLFPSNTVVMGTVFRTTVPCTRCKVSLPPFMSSMTCRSLLTCVLLPHALEQQQRHIKTHFFVTRATVHTQSFFTLIREEQIKVYTCRQCSAKNPSAIRKIPHIHWAELPLIVVALSSSVLNGLEKQFHTLETEEEELKRLRVHVSLSRSLRSVCVSVRGGGQYRLSNNHCLLCCRARQGLFSLEKKGRPIALLDLCTREVAGARGNNSRASILGDDLLLHAHCVSVTYMAKRNNNRAPPPIYVFVYLWDQ